MKIHQYFFVGLLIIGINLSACSKEIIEEEKTKEKIEKKEEKKEKVKEKKIEEERIKDKKEEEKVEEKLEKKETSKFTAPPQNKEELPIIPFDHFGGIPTSLDMDEELLFVGFGRKLDILDFDLKLLGFISLRGVVKQVIAIQMDGAKYLFVREEEGLLEIVKVILGAAPQVIKTFQPFGSFSGPFKAPVQEKGDKKTRFHFFVNLEDKIQILDVTDPADIQVDFELLIPGASQVFGYNDSLYLVQNKHLKIVDWISMATLSSIPIETPFKILGTYQKEETVYLILGLLSSDTSNFRAIQYVPLSPSGGVTQLGLVSELGFEAGKVVMDTTQPYLHVVHDGQASLYDLEKQKVLLGSQNPISSVLYAIGRGGVAFLSSSDFLGKLIYRIHNNTTNNLSPGQVNFLWEKNQVKALAGDIKIVHLLSLNHVLVTNKSVSGEASALFYLSKRTRNSSLLKPVDIGFKGASYFILSHLSPFGLFFYDEVRGKIFYMGEDLTHGEEIKLGGQLVKGIATFQTKEKKFLYLTVAQKEGRGQTSLMTYQFDSAEQIRGLATFSLAEVGGLVVTSNGNRALVACGSKGICDMQISEDRQSLKLNQKIALSDAGSSAHELVLSPDHQWLYVYQELEGRPEGGPIISIHDLKNSFKEISRITGVSLSSSQFKGLTFSSGGHVLILPHNKGVNFYDVTDKMAPHLKFTWPFGPAFYVDVTNRGQTFCVALGKNGVECADWE